VLKNLGSNMKVYMRTNNMELSEARTEELINSAKTYLEADEIDHIRKNLPLLA